MLCRTLVTIFEAEDNSQNRTYHAHVDLTVNWNMRNSTCNNWVASEAGEWVKDGWAESVVTMSGKGRFFGEKEV